MSKLKDPVRRLHKRTGTDAEIFEREDLVVICGHVNVAVRKAEYDEDGEVIQLEGPDQFNRTTVLEPSVDHEGHIRKGFRLYNDRGRLTMIWRGTYQHVHDEHGHIPYDDI